jgi:HD-GYP domain-containing protein (c-di-GMP phosphodiesterase class II)
MTDHTTPHITAQDSVPNREAELTAICRDLAHALNGSLPSRRQMVDDLSNLLLNDNTVDCGTARVAVLTDACAYYERIGRSFEGISRGEAALALAARIGEKNLERRASNVLSTVYLDTAHFDLGCERLQRAFSLAQDLRDPFLECAAMGNTVVLLRTMGLYRDALVVANQVMDYNITTPLGQHVRFLTAATALFCAHRLRDEAAALQFLRIASELIDNPAIDPVARMGFEHSRVVYLLSTRDFETADLLVDSVKRMYGTSTHPRLKVLLGILTGLVDCASGDAERVILGRRILRETYHFSKQRRLYHDDVLRALVMAHGPSSDDRSVGETGLAYAKELVEYTASVKRAKFYKQLADKGFEMHSVPVSNPKFDPFLELRRWLKEPSPSVPSDGFRPRAFYDKNDELSAVHDDLARLRTSALERELRTGAYSTAENWALVAEFFDDQTGQHCFRVGHLAGLLAREIGQEETYCMQIEMAARLHDIGKIAVNEMILLKPGPLDPHEWAATRAHADVGYQLLGGSDDPTLQMAAQVAKYHHEWWNGHGYPNKLEGEDIPLAARICALADVYDALTHARAYKSAWSHRLAIESILAAKGTHFDPNLIYPFLKVLERYASTPAALMATANPAIEQNSLLQSRKKLLELMQVARQDPEQA